MEVKGIGATEHALLAKKADQSKLAHPVEKKAQPAKTEETKTKELASPKPQEKAGSQKMAEGIQDSQKKEGKGGAVDLLG